MDINKIKKNLGILSAIGKTPLIKLSRLSLSCGFNLYAKLELFNPGGSIKDRAALNILLRGIEKGSINSHTTIIECSSGNLGIGLAQVCRYLGLRFICVVDSRTARQNIQILKTYGAEIIMIDTPDPETGEFLPALIRKVKEIMLDIPNSFWSNQHGNLDNALAHYATISEIVDALNEKIDYIFCATSSCGTLRGCYEYISTRGLNIKIYAVDAEGSKIFSKTEHKRIIPGHGAAIIPDLYKSYIQCTPIVVNAKESIYGCRKILNEEAILVGGSSGGIIAAVDKAKDEIKPGANCVLILCDRGERYLDTIFCDEWVNKNGLAC